MNTEEFFRNNHIDTIEKAKTAYIMFGCNKYHMWHDYTDKLEEYESLGISREQELEWTKEQFLLEIKEVKILQSDGGKWSYMYSNLIEKLHSLKEKSHFNMALDITYDLIDKNIDINHYYILDDIIGNSGSKAHGGFIEYAMKNGYFDIGQKAFCLAKQLIDKVYPIISEEQTKHLNWLSENMKDEIIIWPQLDGNHKQNILHKVMKKFKKYMHG